MLENISRYLVDRTIENDIISKDDEELYLYSFQSLIAHIASWMTLAILGVIFGCFWETVVFLVLFAPLRIYAGGFHQGSYLSCYISSLFLFVGIVAFCKLAADYVSVSAIIFSVAVSAVTVILLAPIADENKPLDADETKKYKKISRLILLGEILILSVMLILRMDSRFILFASASPATVALLLGLSFLGRKVQ